MSFLDNSMRCNYKCVGFTRFIQKGKLQISFPKSDILIETIIKCFNIWKHILGCVTLALKLSVNEHN